MLNRTGEKHRWENATDPSTHNTAKIIIWEIFNVALILLSWAKYIILKPRWWCFLYTTRTKFRTGHPQKYIRSQFSRCQSVKIRLNQNNPQCTAPGENYNANWHPHNLHYARRWQHYQRLVTVLANILLQQYHFFQLDQQIYNSGPIQFLNKCCCQLFAMFFPICWYIRSIWGHSASAHRPPPILLLCGLHSLYRYMPSISHTTVN